MYTCHSSFFKRDYTYDNKDCIHQVPATERKGSSVVTVAITVTGCHVKGSPTASTLGAQWFIDFTVPRQAAEEPSTLSRPIRASSVRNNTRYNDLDYRPRRFLKL